MRSVIAKINFAAGIALVLTSFLSLQANNLASLIDSARTDYYNGRFEILSARVNQILQLQPDDPEGNILQGLIWINEGELQDRIKAKEVIEKYASKTKNQVFADFSLGMLYKAQDNGHSARKYFQEAVDADETFVPALIELAESYYQDVLKYYYRYSDTSVPLSYRDYAVEDYDFAVSYLKKALRYDPKNRPAAYLLGSLYFELEDYELMRILFDEFSEYYPRDKNVNQFLGLAYLALRNYEKASEYFQIGLEAMGDEEREEVLNPEYLIKKNSENIENADYWAGKDPMFLTKENERMLEHLGRFAYANLRFSVPRLNIEGWKTDRGKTYIRYGKPNYIVEYGKNLEFDAIYSPMQIWVYPRFQLAFTDEFWNGLYQYTEPPLNSKSTFKERTNVNYTLVAENVFQVLPETFDLELSGGTFQSSYFIKFFRGKTNTDGLLAFLIPKEEELYEPKQELESGFFLLNDKNLPEKEFRNKYVLNYKTELSEPEKSYALQNLTFETKPGRFTYSFELLNKTLEENYVDRRIVEIPRFTSDSLILSDLILADKIGRLPLEATFSRNGLFILPNVTQIYQASDTMKIYFEVYNLDLDTDSLARYQVENSISENKSGGIFKKIFGGGPKKVGFVNEYSGPKQDDFVVQAISLANLKPGEYNLEIILKDEISNLQVTGITKFTILESLTD